MTQDQFRDFDRPILRAVLALGLCLASAGVTWAAENDSAPPTKDPARISVVKTKPQRSRLDEPDLPQWRYRAIQWYFSTFAFIIGACVGSFLNVVIYRLPLGMSLLRADSHCPVCKMPIAFKDNVPIFGWLKLRGRCRECAVRISPRYMLVELGTALLFLMLAQAVLFSGGANLPGHEKLGTSLSSLAALNGELISICLAQCFLASTLLCCVLIEADGHPLPGSLIIPAFLVGMITPYRAATTLSLPAHWPLPNVAEAIVGLVAGGILGATLGIAERYDNAGDRRQRGLIIVLALIGCYLGWDVSLFAAVVTATVMIVIAMLADRLPGLQGIPTITYPALAALFLIPFWNRLSATNWWPRLQDGPLPLIATVTVLLFLALLLRRLRCIDAALKSVEPV